MMKTLVITFLLFVNTTTFSQTSDEAVIKQIFDFALSKGQSYEMLWDLTTNVGSRFSGSPGAAAGVEWSRNVMEQLAFDSVWLQPVMVPHWVRGEKETGRILSKRVGTVQVNVCALGGSVGTGKSGISANVVEVKNLDELKALGTKGVQGKIVFFNRPMDPTKINTFGGYGGAVDQRANGASEAAKYGAVAALIRSMGSNLEDYPHTGGMRYAPNIAKIPAISISTRHAELLSKTLKDEKDLLSNIIKTLNETYGVELTDDDKIDIGRIREKLKNRDDLQAVMTSGNTLENMKYKFDKVVDELLLDFVHTKLDLYKKLSDPKVNPVFKSKWFELYLRQSKTIANEQPTL